MSEYRLADQINWLKTIALCVYYVAFIAFSYYFFLVCRETRHAWIGADILNGIFGAVLIVYPFRAVTRGSLDDWVFWLVILFILTGIAKAIGELIGFA